MILYPKRLSWRMYFRFITSPYSMLRTLEYERIKGMSLKGLSLDVGGGKKTSYMHLFDIKGEIESINIDPKMEPTYLADLNERFPISDNQYDNIISFNTLEHIQADEFVINEIYRVLKPGGKAIICVPFLYRVHASPCDFHRHSAYWWDKTFALIGFEKASIRIEPLMWDIIGSGFAVSEFWCPPRFPSAKCIRYIRRILILFIGVFYQSIRWRGYERLPEEIGAYERDYALGYFIEAKK